MVRFLARRRSTRWALGSAKTRGAYSIFFILACKAAWLLLLLLVPRRGTFLVLPCMYEHKRSARSLREKGIAQSSFESLTQATNLALQMVGTDLIELAWSLARETNMSRRRERGLRVVSQPWGVHNWGLELFNLSSELICRDDVRDDVTKIEVIVSHIHTPNVNSSPLGTYVYITYTVPPNCNANITYIRTTWT